MAGNKMAYAFLIRTKEQCRKNLHCSFLILFGTLHKSKQQATFIVFYVMLY